MVLLLLFLLSSGFSTAQTQTAKQAASVQAGDCSIVGVGYVSNVKIVCEGIPQKDADKLLSVLRELLRDSNATESKLDSIQTKLDEMRSENAHRDIGNLGERAVNLALEMDSFVKREDAADSSYNPVFRQHHTDDEIRKWHRNSEVSTESEFKFHYWDELKQIRQEFAEHNYKSRTLDGIIDRVDSQDKWDQIIDQTGNLHPEMQSSPSPEEAHPSW